MKICNVNLYTSDHRFKKGNLVFGERIKEIEITGEEDRELNYVIPGLIDIHTHGNSGEEFSEASPEGIAKMADYYASNGVTGFAGTTLTLPQKQLLNACRNGAEFSKTRKHGAILRGIHLEGPYFSYNKRGGQNADYLCPPDPDALIELLKASEGLVRLTDIAPELEGAMEYIRKVSEIVRVSIAHTETDYDTAAAAFRAGARHLTHTFNAMNPIAGRAPGPIVAGVENPGVMAEVIGDGMHVAPANVRLLFRLFGAERMILISDSLRCAGLPEGEFMMGGQEIIVKGGLGYLKNGTIAGSAGNLFLNFQKIISFGIPREDAVRAASENPAIALGIFDRVGSIETGKDADLLLLDKNLGLKQTFVMGKEQI